MKIVPSTAQYKELASKVIFTCRISPQLLQGRPGEDEWLPMQWKGPDKKVIGGADERCLRGLYDFIVVFPAFV